MENLNYYLKCTLIEQLNNTPQFLNNVSVSGPLDVTKTARYGTFVGFVWAVFASRFFIQKFRSLVSTQTLKLRESSLDEKVLPRAIALLVLVLVLPLLIVFLLFVYIYKLLCSIIIKRKDKHFVGYLDSFDVFWSLEDDTAQSVINVLGVIESDSPFSVVNNIKDKLQNIVPKDDADKIFFRRNEDYGFYYWRRYSSIDINEYVDMVELPTKPNGPNIEDLENLMTEISSQALPYNNEGLFKILITKQRVGGNQDAIRGEYGIVFRIHHSVGDGVALIEFLCNTLADNKEDCPVNMFSNPKAYNTRNPDSPKHLIGMIQKLWEIPICFVDGILRKPDKNSLHGSELLNKRIFKWTESDENLLIMVKEIKDNVHQMKFTDVLAAALSTGLHNFFSQTMRHIPKDIAVVLPVRFPKTSMTDSNLKLENDFSVTIVDLPVKKQRIDAVHDRCDALRRSADPLTNYYLLKVLNSVLPKQVLQPLLTSSQATMVFSNMPGPKRLSICGGVLKELVFFVPQKGNTGIGITALCYDGILRFGAAADAALVSEPADLTLILDSMVAEIRRLHREYVK